ncbi:MAG: hypothetical protein ACXW1M_09395 [Acidimicrobiia bacterium]
MPWCPTCARYLAPPSVHADGTCPTCGHRVDPGRARAQPDDLDGDPVSLPWHFKLLAGALAVYLGYRAFQGIEWLAGRL